ncbi:aldehyde dehydrogenase family protein, partial [Rhodococcus hoagii]|nr:aldehyde dehydrogenase family protein [Prescottella equi]
TDQQIADALDASQAAYEHGPGSRWPSAPRREADLRLLAERSKDIAALITTEMGKALGAAVGEVRYSAQIFGYYADEAESCSRTSRSAVLRHEAFVQRLPIGPLLGSCRGTSRCTVARFVAPNLVLATPSCSSTPRSTRRWRSC